MITVVGLGYQTISDLSIKAVAVLREATRIVTTASWHPVFSEIPNKNIEKWDTWTVLKIIAALTNTATSDELVLAVAGDPNVDATYLKAIKHDMEVISAPTLLQKLPLPSSWQVINDFNKDSSINLPSVIRVHFGEWEALKPLLPQDELVYYVDKLSPGQARVRELTLEDGYILVEPNKPSRKSSINELLEIMERLRRPDGCPWDKIQTFESLKPYVVEEAYELWDAIDSGDPYLMAEELGDILLQVVFHSTIAKEKGLFDFEKVAADVNKKLIHRHPHVFGDVVADTPERVLLNWDAIKKNEKGKEDRVSILDGIPTHLPSLEKAAKTQKKAAKVGFDWTEIEPVWDKVKEELTELSQAQTNEHREEELGDVLFAIVNLARFLKIDPEVALTKTINKFQKRFRYIEEHADRPLEEMTLEEMDVFWDKAKKEDK